MSEPTSEAAEPLAEGPASEGREADADASDERAAGASEAAAFDAAKASWGFPAFARDFPRDPALDALVAAFARGDYRAVREGAPAIAASDAPDEVKRAAALLRDRTAPDPTAKIIFLLTAALLATLTGWWVTHDGPPDVHAPAPAPTIEIVK